MCTEILITVRQFQGFKSGKAGLIVFRTPFGDFNHRKLENVSFNLLTMGRQGVTPPTRRRMWTNSTYPSSHTTLTSMHREHRPLLGPARRVAMPAAQNSGGKKRPVNAKRRRAGLREAENFTHENSRLQL